MSIDAITKQESSTSRCVSARTVQRSFGLALALLTAIGCSGGAQGEGAGDTSSEATTGAFVHPGVLHSRAELDLVRAEVQQRKQLRVLGWDALRGQAEAKLGYRHHARSAIKVDGSTSDGFTSDAIAAYAHALQWYVTRDAAHAQAARDILDAYADTCKSIAPGSGQYSMQDRLVTGWVTARFATAAEIMRDPEAGWSAGGIQRFKTLLANVFWPQVSQTPPGCNKNDVAGCFQRGGERRASNHEASYAEAQLAIGVFNDDRAKFDEGLKRWRWVLGEYVLPSGENGETCRDHGHSQMGLGALAHGAEIALKQGVDLYAESGNRLAVGFEYEAKWMSGLPQPSRCGGQGSRPGPLRPTWEIALNAYSTRKGLDLPYTRKVAERSRAERCHFTGMFCAGTLMYAQNSAAGGGQPPTANNAGAGSPPVEDPSLLAVASVEASAVDGSNVAASAVDGDLLTRWSAPTLGDSLTLALTQPSTLGAVRVAFYRGDVRTAKFDLQVSTDGSVYRTIAAGLTSSGTSLQLQTFAVTVEREVRSVRLVGQGNSENAWNSINEVQLVRGDD